MTRLLSNPFDIDTVENHDQRHTPTDGRPNPDSEIMGDGDNRRKSCQREALDCIDDPTANVPPGPRQFRRAMYRGDRAPWDSSRPGSTRKKRREHVLLGPMRMQHHRAPRVDKPAGAPQDLPETTARLVDDGHGNSYVPKGIRERTLVHQETGGLDHCAPPLGDHEVKHHRFRPAPYVARDDVENAQCRGSAIVRTRHGSPVR